MSKVTSIVLLMKIVKLFVIVISIILNVVLREHIGMGIGMVLGIVIGNVCILFLGIMVWTVLDGC